MWNLSLSTCAILSLAHLVGADPQFFHHSPVIHHDNGQSYQTFTYFGHNVAPAVAPPYVPAPYVASPDVAAPASYVPFVSAPKQTTHAKNNKVVRRPIFSRFKPLYLNNDPSALNEINIRAGSNVELGVSTTTVAPFTTTDFTTTPFTPVELRTDIPATQIVDSALNDLRTGGPKLVNIVQKLQTNRLIKRFLSSSEDPCSVLPENIAGVVATLNSAIIASRSELTTVVAAAQEMKRNENDTQVVLQEAGKALLAVNPLIPIFQNVFPKNAGCESNIQSTVSGFDTVGGLLEVLGTTNLITSDAAVKAKITKGGLSTKILGDLTRKLESGGFTSLCENSPTFSSDVFMGVSELFEAFNRIAGTFDADSELSQLDTTVAVIKDGAELLKDLNFVDSAAQRAIPRSGGECVTSIPAVAKTLQDVADLVSVIDTSR